jgi:hypothetical protein
VLVKSGNKNFHHENILGGELHDVLLRLSKRKLARAVDNAYVCEDDTSAVEPETMDYVKGKKMDISDQILRIQETVPVLGVSVIDDWIDSNMLLDALDGDDDLVPLELTLLFKSIGESKKERLRQNFVDAFELLKKMHTDLKCPQKMHANFWKAHSEMSAGNIVSIVLRLSQLNNARNTLMGLLRALVGRAAPNDRLLSLKPGPVKRGMSSGSRESASSSSSTRIRPHTSGSINGNRGASSNNPPTISEEDETGAVGERDKSDKSDKSPESKPKPENKEEEDEDEDKPAKNSLKKRPQSASMSIPPTSTSNAQATQVRAEARLALSLKQNGSNGATTNSDDFQTLTQGSGRITSTRTAVDNSLEEMRSSENFISSPKPQPHSPLASGAGSGYDPYKRHSSRFGQHKAETQDQAGLEKKKQEDEIILFGLFKKYLSVLPWVKDLKTFIFSGKDYYTSYKNISDNLEAMKLTVKP